MEKEKVRLLYLIAQENMLMIFITKREFLLWIKLYLTTGPKKEETKGDEIAAIKPPTTQKKKKQNNDDSVPPTIEDEKNYEDDPAFYKTVEVLPEPYGGMELFTKRLAIPKKQKKKKLREW